MKVLHSICQQIWKTQQWPRDWKRSVFIPIPNKGNAKECSNYLTIALISHASKVMLKILQARLQQLLNHEFPDVQAGFRKGRGTRDQIANIHWIMEKAKEFQLTPNSQSFPPSQMLKLGFPAPASEPTHKSLFCKLGELLSLPQACNPHPLNGNNFTYLKL